MYIGSSVIQWVVYVGIKCTTQKGHKRLDRRPCTHNVHGLQVPSNPVSATSRETIRPDCPAAAFWTLTQPLHHTSCIGWLPHLAPDKTAMQGFSLYYFHSHSASVGYWRWHVKSNWLWNLLTIDIQLGHSYLTVCSVNVVLFPYVLVFNRSSSSNILRS